MNLKVYMNLKTCLLITDDPDDHDAFSEALSEIASQNILFVISNSEKALALLQSKRHRPDYIFVDLTMYGMRKNYFLNTMSGDFELADIPIILYGDKTDCDKMNGFHCPFLSKDYSYAELRIFLAQVFKSEP